MPDIEIISTRTIIRPFAEADASDIFASISPEITRFMAWDPPAILIDFEEIWRSWLSSLAELTDVHLVARGGKTARFVGIVGLHALQSTTPELGIWLRQDMHGMGYGRELIGAVTTWASKCTEIDYFVYPVAEENVASRRIAEAYGGKIKDKQEHPKYSSVVYHIPPVR
ncbi:GNAT family N-acetyltransferase [Ochrobactrum sp. CM-21-5]|nr:GNAT family N-acetyltransferase [Ochrobactrum sp. CM-21-5]MBC2885399.1 GNAT family N-acetyltransferase [Ochrobactrum sp. CM-21-5]